MCRIEPLNAKFEGAKVTSVETVFKIHISDFLNQNSDFDPITDKNQNQNHHVIVFKSFSNLSG